MINPMRIILRQIFCLLWLILFSCFAFSYSSENNSNSVLTSSNEIIQENKVGKSSFDLKNLNPAVANTPKSEEEINKLKLKTEQLKVLQQIITLCVIILTLIIGPIIAFIFRGRFKRWFESLSFQQFIKVQEEFFKKVFLISPICAEYMKYLFLLFLFKKDYDICNNSDKLSKLLKNPLSQSIPTPLMQGGLDVVAEKCSKAKKDYVSERLFNCFSYFYRFPLAPEIFLSYFQKLLPTNKSKHVRHFALIEFCAFTKVHNPLSWPNVSPYVANIKASFRNLKSIREKNKSWDKEQFEELKVCLYSLVDVSNLPDVIKEVLPSAVDIVCEDVNNLVGIFAEVIFRLGDFSRFGYDTKEYVKGRIEGWLQASIVKKEFQTDLIPKMINSIDSTRGVRRAPRVYRIKPICIFADVNRREHLTGEMADISSTGINFNFDKYSLERGYKQFRKPGEDGFPIVSKDKKLKLSLVNLDIYHPNKEDVCVGNIKTELVRAFIPDKFKSISQAGFGGEFTSDNDFEKIKKFIIELGE